MEKAAIAMYPRVVEIEVDAGTVQPNTILRTSAPQDRKFRRPEHFKGRRPVTFGCMVRRGVLNSGQALPSASAPLTNKPFHDAR